MSGGGRAAGGPAAAVPRVAAPPGRLDALGWDALLGGPNESLAPYIARQRWAGARGAGVRAAAVEHVVALPAPGARYALAVVGAELGDGSRVRYLLPLVYRRPDAAAAAGEALVTAADGADRRGVYEAAHDAGFRAALHALLAAGGTVEQADARLAADSFDAGGAAAAAEPPASRVIAGEQSNTSIIYDDGSIVKLFRRVEVGENPDVEIGAALGARGGASRVPRLLGTLRYTDAAGTAVVAMRQALVPGAQDAWAYTLDRARADVQAAAAGTVHWSYTADAERLGGVTRELHEALAAQLAHPAFAPERATRADVARWAAAAQRAVRDGLDLLARQLAAGAVGDALADEAASMLAWRDAFLARCDDAAALVGDDAGLLIRHHGDYHLGQLLRAASGDFYVIDFEGEPMRPLAERRAKHSALRDVAGMLRSFGYAAAVVASERGGAAEPGHPPDPRAAVWEEHARRAFRRGYERADGGRSAPFLPEAPERTGALVSLFEIEKVFYELAYEVQNRPGWTWIPLLGLSQLLGR